MMFTRLLTGESPSVCVNMYHGMFAMFQSVCEPEGDRSMNCSSEKPQTLLKAGVMLTPPLAHLSIHTYTCVCTATRTEFRVSHCAPGCRRRQRVTACTRPRGALGFALARAPGLDVGPCLRAPCAPWRPRGGPDWRLGPSLPASPSKTEYGK